MRKQCNALIAIVNGENQTCGDIIFGKKRYCFLCSAVDSSKPYSCVECRKPNCVKGLGYTCKECVNCVESEQ